MDNLVDVRNLLEAELKPQIDKLRFVRELSLNAEMDALTRQEHEESHDIALGLYSLLRDVTTAFDKVYSEIEKQL